MRRINYSLPQNCFKLFRMFGIFPDPRDERTQPHSSRFAPLVVMEERALKKAKKPAQTVALGYDK